MDWFSLDSPFIQALDRITDYIILSLLCVLTCLPVFTIGTSLTAKYYVALKLVRGEDVPVAKAYFKAFRNNFKQTAPVSILGTVMGACIFFAWYQVIYGIGADTTYKVILTIVTYLWWSVFFCVFSILSYYNATTKEAMKGALVMTIVDAHKLILLFLSLLIPFIVALWYIQWGLAIWMLSTSSVLYYSAKMLNKELGKMTGEGKEEEEV